MAIPEERELGGTAQWKAVSHPLRLGILRLLADGSERTNEELAKALGEASGKLYFHTKRLLDAGLIEPAGTRQKGHLTEKLYRATARRFTVSSLEEAAASGGGPPLLPLLNAALELYANSWQETNGLSDETHLGFHLVLPQSPERLRDFIARLRALFDDFQDEGAGDTPGARATSLAVLLHTFPTERTKTEEKP